MILTWKATATDGFNIRMVVVAPHNGLKIYGVNVFDTKHTYRVDVVAMSHTTKDRLLPEMKRLSPYHYGDVSMEFCGGIRINGTPRAIVGEDTYHLSLRDRSDRGCFEMHPYDALGITVKFGLTHGEATIEVDADDICLNCKEGKSTHLGDKCLFASTHWRTPWTPAHAR